jgi:replicative DNA helicase
VTPSATASRFTRGEPLFVDWQKSVLHGTGPVVYPHTLPGPELSPGIVTLIGGAPGAGKTALVMQCVVEALRFNSSLRALVCNVEMSPEALLDRQLARLAGIDGEVIRHRRFTAEHREPLERGLATIESFVPRLTFLQSPFDLSNVASAADACDADIIVIDYVQRFSCPGDDGDARAKVSRTMDYLRRFADADRAVVVLSAIGRTKDTHGRTTYSGAGLASFRESSELEFGADNAYVLSPIDESSPDAVRLAHLKARHGATRTVDLAFDRPLQRFALADEQPDAPPATSDAPPKRKAKRKAKPAEATPYPEFTTENLAKLWATTTVAPDDAVGDDREGG